MGPRRLRSLLRAVRRPSLLVQYAVVSLGLVFGLGVVLAQRVGESIERSTIESSARMIGATSQFVLGSGMASTEAAPNSPAQMLVIARALRDRRLPDRIVEARVVMPNRTVVFATEPGLLGKRAGDPAAVRRALRAGTAARVVDSTSVGVTSRAYSALVARNGRLLEVYATVHVPTTIPTLVLVYSLPYAPVAATVAAKKHDLFAALFGGLAILYLVLFRLVASASRRLRTHAEENRRLALHDALTGLPNR